MTSLFRRLARQVVGQPLNKVHAMACLPFVAPAEPPPASDLEVGAIGVSSATEPASKPVSARVSTRASSTAPPSATPAAQVASNRQATTPDLRTASAAEPALATATTAPETGHAKSADDGAEVDTPAPARSVDPRPPVRADREPLPAVQAAPPIRRRAAIDSAESQPLPPLVDTVVIDIPPPLVQSPANRFGINGTRSPAPPQVRARQTGDGTRTITSAAAAANEPAEVHVHIGRIEVTAVPEAAPARTKPQASRPPMSLEEYLARRQRRRL